ncbi:DMT family transporter [Engelhardtia mirabilis]|uniref:DMT family transporter n=1 Tax=Engelhardtia mirabilis TaxID=2528011 RepID=A0A518BJL3_9BACT|nr:hypothetical protein Pla133_22360 [Planctomycetes bacterium Pla133]QDV01485.1 hypothetical protein Pla86_22360 [Planctomycetes bacterium Pla86]
MKLVTVISVLAALLAGAFVALQPGINGQLAARLGTPLRAGVISFGVGCSLLCLIALVSGHGLPRPSQLHGAPLWLYLGGGAVGAMFVTTAMIVAPRIGATYFVALIFTGQMAASLVLDHFGWLGFPRSPANLGRLLGVCLLIGGLMLVARPDSSKGGRTTPIEPGSGQQTD